MSPGCSHEVVMNQIGRAWGATRGSAHCGTVKVGPAVWKPKTNALQKRMMSGASAGSPRKTGRLLPLPRPPASHASAPGAAAVNDPEHLREQLAAVLEQIAELRRQQQAQIAELRRQQQAILTVECVPAVCVSCAIRSTHARTHT